MFAARGSLTKRRLPNHSTNLLPPQYQVTNWRKTQPKAQTSQAVVRFPLRSISGERYVSVLGIRPVLWVSHEFTVLKRATPKSAILRMPWPPVEFSQGYQRMFSGLISPWRPNRLRRWGSLPALSVRMSRFFLSLSTCSVKWKTLNNVVPDVVAYLCILLRASARPRHCSMIHVPIISPPGGFSYRFQNSKRSASAHGNMKWNFLACWKVVNRVIKCLWAWRLFEILSRTVASWLNASWLLDFNSLIAKTFP